MKSISSLQSNSLLNLSQGKTDDEGGLDLGSVVGTLRRKLPLIAGVTTVIASAALIKALTDTPVYQGQFEILTEPVTIETQVISSVPGTISSTDQASSSVLDATKVKVLRSPRVISPVVEKLVEKYPDASYGSIVSGLNIQVAGQDILAVSYINVDPQKVRDVLEAISQAYLDYSLEERQSDIRKGIDFVDEQLPLLEGRVSRLEDQLETFRERYSLVEPQSQADQLSGQLNGFVQQRLATQVELSQARSLYTDLQQQLLTHSAESAASSALASNSRYQDLLNQLLQIDSQIAQESTLFLDDSPNLRLLRAQRENLLPLLTQEGQRAQATVASRIRELEAQNRALTQAIDLVTTQLNQLPAIAREYAEIQRELQIANENLNQFLAKREALRIDVAQREVPWQLLTPPGEPFASSTSVKKNLALGIILGLLLGSGVALVTDKFTGVLRTPREVRDVTKLPVLGVIPFNEELGEPGFSAGVTTFIKHFGQFSQSVGDRDFQSFENSPFIEAFRSLYTNIRLLSSETPIRSLVMTSSSPFEGKTTTSTYLAYVAAAMGQRVLVVDTDLRRPRLHQSFGLPNEMGLVDVMLGNSEFHEVIQTSPTEDNLHILTAGDTPLDSTKLLSSARMQGLIQQLREEYDLVIYDTPPLLGFADAYIVAAHTDGILLVAGLDKLKRSWLNQVMEELTISRLPVLGTVASGARGVSPIPYMSYGYYNVEPEQNGAVLTLSETFASKILGKKEP